MIRNEYCIRTRAMSAARSSQSWRRRAYVPRGSDSCRGSAHDTIFLGGIGMKSAANT